MWPYKKGTIVLYTSGSCINLAIYSIYFFLLKFFQYTGLNNNNQSKKENIGINKKRKKKSYLIYTVRKT